MKPTGKDIMEKFSELIHHLDGPLNLEINGPSLVHHAQPGDLVFVSKEENLTRALESQASAIVILKELIEDGFSAPNHKTLFVTDNVMLAMALINQEYFPVQELREPFEGHRIHPTALVASSAQLGADTIIGPYAVIGEDTVIGDHCIIGAQATIERKVKIGSKTHIFPQVFIGHTCIIGSHCEIHPQTSIGTFGYGYAHDKKGNYYRIPHYGRVVIEDDVHIGAGVCIDRGTYEDTQIGEGTKIDNHCHIAHNVKIGKGCLITAGLIAAGSVEVGDHCVFGGRVSLAGHIKITDKVQIAALSGASSGVDKPGTYGGFPLQPMKKFLKNYASSTHLAEFRKELNDIKKKVDLK